MESAILLLSCPARCPARDAEDLLAVAVLYVAVVALMRLELVVFPDERVLGLFLAFAGALVLGVVGSVGSKPAGLVAASDSVGLLLRQCGGW